MADRAGRGSKDQSQAIYWWQQAAEQGNKDASDLLGELQGQDLIARAKKSPPDQDAAEIVVTRDADARVKQMLDSRRLIGANRAAVLFDYKHSDDCDAAVEVFYDFTFYTQGGLQRSNRGHLYYYHNPRNGVWYNSQIDIDGLPQYGLQ
jgi:TPR repeat protein